MRPTVDPSFGQRLREFRMKRCLSLRALGKLVNFSHTQIWEWETGRADPRSEAARLLDGALDAHGELAAMVVDEGAVLNPDDVDRLAHVARAPRTVDLPAVESFGVILAHQRRLEDLVGSAAVLGPVTCQLTMMKGLVTEASGAVRAPLVDEAAQWAQFAGWLHSNSGSYQEAERWLTTALDWATEVSDPNMIATVLSFKGHVAYRLGRVGPTIGLSAAAQRDPTVYVEQRAFSALQEARGHAMGGDAAAAGEKLAEAADLVTEVGETTKPIPPWSYYYRSPGFFDLVTGMVYRYLGREDPSASIRAAKAFQAGRSALPDDMRDSEWAGEFVYHMAVACAQAGDNANAAAALEDARQIAATTGAEQLRHQVEQLARRLGL